MRLIAADLTAFPRPRDGGGSGVEKSDVEKEVGAETGRLLRPGELLSLYPYF